jgi:hypothetical protein
LKVEEKAMQLIKESKTRTQILEYLTATATADCEADVDALLQTFNPVEDRAEMGQVFQKALGYNPITYYDINDVLKAIDQLAEKSELTVASGHVMKDNKEAIVQRALEIYDESREFNLKQSLAKALDEFLDDEEAAKARTFLIGVNGNIVHELLEAIPDVDDEDDEEDTGLPSVEGDMDDDDLSSLNMGDEDDMYDYGFGKEEDDD